MDWLATLLGVDPDLLKLVTALLSLIAAACTATSAVYGVLNRRARIRTEATTRSTNAAVAGLLKLLNDQKADREQLWKAYREKDAVATPDGVRKIAAEAATLTARAELLPVHEFFAALETVESRRTHRPETDVLAILQGASAA